MNYATDDTLVINDYPENLNEIARGLKQLEIRPKQVLVEATILNAQLTDNNALGVDIVSLSGVDFPNLVNVFGTATGTGGSGGSGGTTGVSSPGDLAGKLIADGSSQTNIGTSFANAVPPGGLSIGFLNNHVSAFVRALETVTNTSVVANPKVLTLNKHRGEVLIGQKLGYLTTSTSQTTTDQTVLFIDVGTKLVFRPFIGDNGYIRMEIHPEDSSGSIDSKGIPQKATTEVTSNIMIKDGRTVVIGGLFREAITAGRGQVPVLGNIPIIGVPFRQTSDNTQRSETIALITPHIINDDTAMYDQAEKEAADIQRLMLGNRAGLQTWSRDRIAQLWYSKAQEQLDKGCKDKAIMYLDWALNTQPQFIEALKLREKINGTKMEEATQSTISNFVRDVLDQDAPTTPDTGSSGHYPPPPVQPVVPVAPATRPAATQP
jgi:type II secretory pathway component GspD/PulD (secretin)